MINSKLISELVSSDKTVLCSTSMANSVKKNNLLAHAQLQNSVNTALSPERNIAQTSKETNWWSFDESFVWKIVLSFSKYFSSNTFSQNIKNCSVAFSLLFSIA